MLFRAKSDFLIEANSFEEAEQRFKEIGAVHIYNVDMTGKTLHDFDTYELEDDVWVVQSPHEQIKQALNKAYLLILQHAEGR